ncbi:hypothetical protein [Microbulbifer celer]|uniref:Nucleotidyltransferase family protein n=1 Tax=Microbulbifer celer TaxID=435905 RepID=A0ABW3U6F4_9GAMM|nr:hypothetical protein [Microbulbifer celer]UFN58600.1 hypothetical protein LPW13_06030 [Microbulbifer celer]
MSPISGLTRLELAALIAETLKKAGINVVLSGGSCVSIYSSENYVSKDLDFIDISLKSNRQIAKAIQSLGFENQPKNSRHFIHPDTELSVEFPSAPLTIGDEYIPSSAVNSIATEHGTLRLLTPTDCVKDRLANYYYFGDKQCLEQALLVARAHPVNLASLQRWHDNEQEQEGYQDFLILLSEK